VSEGDRDWHCDISRNGRRAVVDTNPVYEWPGAPWDAAPGNSDIVVVDMESGRRTFLARTSWSGRQHPHPVFTPDGAAVLFHRSDAGGGADILRADVFQ
jgi:Tol biopolymer transport system component